MELIDVADIERQLLAIIRMEGKERYIALRELTDRWGVTVEITATFWNESIGIYHDGKLIAWLQYNGITRG